MLDITLVLLLHSIQDSVPFHKKMKGDDDGRAIAELSMKLQENSTRLKQVCSCLCLW